MKKIFNKKAFTLVEIVVAIGILAAASVGIGAIVVAVQNNSQKQFTQGDLQQQLSNVQESLKNDLLTTNAGVKYWIQDDAGSYVESDGANKNPERNKIVAMYTMDYIDNTLTKTYVKYDANEDILYKAEMSETVTFDHSKKKLLDEKPEEVTDNSALDWYVYAQGITNFSMDLSKYSENQTINYNVNISHTNNNFESDNTVNVRNEIPINEATVLENYDQAVVTRPALKNRQFVYNGQEQAPKQLDVNSRYVEIRLTDPERDRVSATNVGQYRITYHLKNAVWEDGSTDDYTLEWEIIPRALTVEWTEWTWIYDGSAHTAQYLLGNNAPADNISTLVELHNGTVGPNYGTQIASLEVKNPNYTITENQEKEISITKGIAEYTVVPQPAGSADNPLVYNGQYQPLVKPGSTTCGTIYYSLSANTGFSPEVPTAKSANGENPYVVYYYIQGSGSYADSEIKYMEVVMQRAVPAINKPIPYDGINHVTYYSGVAQSLLYFAGTTSAATNEATNLVYSLDGNVYTPEIPTGVTATQYTVWYKSQETADFKETIPQYVEARIAKTQRPSDSFTLPQINNLTYTGKLQPLFVPGTGTATQAASWMYKLPEGEWSSIIPEKDAAGTYEVYLKLPETADYAEYVIEAPVMVTIDKAPAQYKINGKPDMLPYLMYTGQPQSLIAHGLTQDGIIQYAVAQATTPPNKNMFSEKVPQGTNAGKYNVFYYIKGDSNHYDSDILLLEAEILAATPIIAASPVALNAPYNGEDQTLLIVQGISDNGTPLQYMLNNNNEGWSEIPPVAKDVGEYTIYYKVPADDNYADSAIGELVASITQADTKIESPIPNEGLVYNGQEQYLCQEGSTQFGVFEYSINSKQQWSTNLPRAINSGKYDIYWRVQGTANYKGAEGKIVVNINKQTVESLPPVVQDLTYTGAPQQLLDPTTGSVPSGYHFEYREADPSAQWQIEPPYGTDAGTYFVEYRVVSNNNDIGGNIDTSAQELTVVIHPAVPVVSVVGVENLVFNGTEQQLIDSTLTTTSLGTLEYSLDSTGLYSTQIPTAQHAGTYSVYWQTVASHNLVQQKGITTVTVQKLRVDYPVVEPLQMQYTGEYQFPEITQTSPYISIAEGSVVQKDVSPNGYDIVFELLNDSVLWQDGLPNNYTVTWYITKGESLPFTPPSPTPKTFTGAAQLIFSPVECNPGVGSVQYRIAAFKPNGSSTWEEYTETDKPWVEDAPLVTDVGDYKFVYKIDSFNYDSWPETTFTSSIDKGVMSVIIANTQLQFTGESQQPDIRVAPLGIATDGSDDGWIKDEHGNLVAQERVLIEVSTDSGKTWKTYRAKHDPRYDPTTCYPGATAPGTYALSVRVTDLLGEYETYSQPNCALKISAGEASWVGLPEANSLSYIGTAQELVADGAEKTGMHFEYQCAKAHFDGEELKYDGSFSSQSANIPKQTNAGTYAIRIWAVADKNYKIITESGEEVDKLEVAVIPATIMKATIQVDTLPYLKNELLYYTGSNQSLGLVSGTLGGNYGSSYFAFTVSYYATPDSAPEVFKTEANKTINNQKVVYDGNKVNQGYPKPKKAGTYVIYWWVQGDDNHESYYHFVDGVEQATLTAQIITVEDKKVVTALNAAYTGKSQQIFILPANTQLSEDGTTWVKDATQISNMIHKTDIGSYSLYWRINTGATQGPVTATISSSTLDANKLKDMCNNDTIQQVIFSKNHDVNNIPISAVDISEEQNKGVFAWQEENTLFIASAAIGQRVIAPADCSELLANLPNAIAVDLSGLDTSQTTNMSKMLYNFGANTTEDVHILGLMTLNTQSVTNASSMFENAARTTNAVYAPNLNQLTFSATTDKTDWLKNFAANANIKETGLPSNTETSDEGDSVSLVDDDVFMFAGSLQEETLIAGTWTVTYEGTAVTINQLDYLRASTPYVGDGEYIFTGVLKNIYGEIIDITVSSYVETNAEIVDAQTSIVDDLLTMYAMSMANKNIISGEWTASWEYVPIETRDVTIIDALTVQVPVYGPGLYTFDGRLYDSDGKLHKVRINVTVEATEE